jgi:hypothetical protein
MQRSAVQRHPDRAPRLDRPRERLGPEVLEPRPERDVRVPRHLRLHRDEALDRRERGRAPPAQQELSREERAVQLAVRQHAGAWRHRPMLPDTPEARDGSSWLP